MSQNYSTLAAFMRAHKANPLALAKVMTAWAWGSLLPGGSVEPTNAHQVPTFLSARCGWRDVLMESLFSEIGIPHRRVNFYDVPFQVNHTATELFINGKWMFFDASFGTFLLKEGSSTPLSMQEARDAWPDVRVMQCTLPGMQDKFLDPSKISTQSFAEKDSTFFFLPPSYTYMQNEYLVCGQVQTLYFGPKATYVDSNGDESAIPSGGQHWSVRTDPSDKKSWSKTVTYFDQSGKRDAIHVLFDDHREQFSEYDVGNKEDWLRKVTLVDKNHAFVHQDILFDDRSKIVIDVDSKLQQPWALITSAYASNGKLDYKLTQYDNHYSFVTVNDAYGLSSWSRYDDTYSASGTVKTTVYYDNGTVASYDWATSQHTSGTVGSDALSGTNGSDAIFGFAGNDTLDGGAGADRLEGGIGNDAYFVDTGEDFVIERPDEGTDTVFSSVSYMLGPNLENLVLQGDAVYGSGNAESNKLLGNNKANSLSGLGGNDYIKGYGGDDSLNGGIGNDTLEPGSGVDKLQGGSGADVFIWGTLSDAGLSKAASDLVLDFSKSEGDIIHLRSIDADETRAGNQAFTFIGTAGFSAPGQLRYVHSGHETLIYFNTDHDLAADGVLRLAGTLDPDASWFVL